MRSLKVIIFGFICIGGVSLVSALCPPAEELLPYCACDEEKLQFYCSQPWNDTQVWDIKGTFDRVGSLVPADTVFGSIVITETKLKEIPSGAIRTLKFKNLTIEFNYELETIHPDAFNETLETTTRLVIALNPRLANEGPNTTADNVFSVIRKFNKLEYLEIERNNITIFPDNAFGFLPNLTRIVYAGDATLNYIGNRTFAGLPSLEYVSLYASDISLDEINEDAFVGIGKAAHVDLEGNKFTRLPRNIFKPLLDNARLVSVGGKICIGFICYDVEMDCDEESEWICEDLPKYQQVLEGFNCRKNSEFTDIFEYCLASNK